MRPVLPLLLSATTLFAGGPLRFRVTLDPSLSPKAASGRLFVLMSDAPEKKDRLAVGFVPGATWLAAMEIEHFAPGATVEIDPDLKAYPQPFSKAHSGDYQFMAVLDPDHTFARGGQDPGDLFGPVVQIKQLDPANAEPVALILNKLTEPRRQPPESPNARLVEFESRLLSEFWGRPIVMRAAVVLPPKYAERAAHRYPAVYNVHGFGGNHQSGLYRAASIAKAIAEGKRAEMVQVFLDASFSSGHHVFADSVNNGPWGRALTEEFIPHLEKTFRLVAKPHARFLTGHSSGGWSTLWLQVSYPDFFGGVWSTAPDPVDFRSFTGIDAMPGSTQNAFRAKDGKPLNLVRMNGKEMASFEQFARQEEVMGEFGGQLASFEWVFSPRGPDGRPMRLFSRATGEQDSFVQQYWQRYDIRLQLQRNWIALGPKLQGKLHIVCGKEDTFHLEEAVTLLCDFLKSKGREDTCEIVPGRDHMNLYRSYDTYPDGLELRIDREMWKTFEAANK